MRIRPIHLAMLIALGCASTASSSQVERASPAPAGNRSQASDIRLAQECGYFAILGCFATRGQATDWNNRIEEGHVINTTSDAYPNFRPGYYCVVAGPTSQQRANRIKAGWRSVVPDAYVKNSC